jgi:hypothetical protein
MCPFSAADASLEWPVQTIGVEAQSLEPICSTVPNGSCSRAVVVARMAPC